MTTQILNYLNPISGLICKDCGYVSILTIQITITSDQQEFRNSQKYNFLNSSPSIFVKKILFLDRNKIGNEGIEKLFSSQLNKLKKLRLGSSEKI